jgi:DNA-binding beta-propeller fold protein YncE
MSSFVMRSAGRILAAVTVSLVSLVGVATSAQAETDAPPAPITFAAGHIHYSASSADGATVALSDYDGSAVFLIDTATSTLTQVSDPAGELNEPCQIVFSPDGSTLYVANFKGENIAVISVADAAVTSTLDSPDLEAPSSLAISPDGSHLYVGDYTAATIVDVDIATGQTVSTPASVEPYSMFVSPDGAFVYSIDLLGSVLKYDTASHAVTETWSNVTGEFFNTCVNSDVSVLFMPEHGGDLYAISLADGSILAEATDLEIGTDIEGCAVSPDDAVVVLADRSTGEADRDTAAVTAPGSIYAVDANTLELVAPVTTPAVANTMAVAFFSDCLAYVAGDEGNAQTFDYCAFAAPKPDVTGRNVLVIGGVMLALVAGVVILSFSRRKSLGRD